MRAKIMEVLLTLGPMKIGPLSYVAEVDRDEAVRELAVLVKERRVYFEEMDETFWYAEAT